MVPLRITIYKTRECQFQFIMKIDSNQNLPDLVNIDHCLHMERNLNGQILEAT